ncbi:MAG: YfhO family protein [Bacilli bacterium]
MKKNIYWQYSIYFLIILGIISLPLIINKGLFIDGLTQHIVFFRDYISQLKSFIQGNAFFVYRPDLGLGSDVFTYYTFYSLFDPLNLIAVMLPIKWIGFEYGLFVGVRLYFAGIFFLWLLKHQQVKSHKALLLSALFYVFNVTVLYSAFRHPMFINGVLWLPLIFLGAMKCLEGKHAYLLLIGAFFAFITQFYLSIYSTIAFEAFVVIKLWLSRKTLTKKVLFKKWFNVNMWFALGILLAGFVLVPQLLAVYNGARATTKGLIIFDSLYYLGTFSSFFIPMISSSYTSSLGNGFVFFLVLVYAFQNKRDWKTIFFTVFSLLLLVSVFGYTVNVFSYVNNRWSYILLVPASLALGEILEKKDTLVNDDFQKPVKLIISLLIAMVFWLFGYIGSQGTNRSFNITWQIFMVNCIILEILIINQKQIMFGLFEKWKQISLKTAPKILIVSYIVFGLAISLTYVFSQTTATNLEAYDHEEAFLNFPSDEYYRIDQSSYVLKSDYLGNDNLVYGFKSPYAYNSMVPASIAAVIDYYSVYNLNSTVGYTGFNNRTALNAINQVKYMMIKANDNKAIPYGFSEDFSFYLNEVENPTIANGGTLTGELEEVTVYKTNHFLPFGFVYHQFVQKSQADALNAIEKENLLLTHALILDGASDVTYNNILKQNATDVLYHNVVKSGNTYFCDQEASVSFTIDYLAGFDLYFHADTIRNIDNKKVNYYVEAYQNNQLISRFRETLYAKGTFFYYDNHEPLINLGAFSSGELQVKITFDPGRYEIVNMGYYLNNVQDVGLKINELKQETLNNLQFNANGFNGDITLNEDGLLFVSLPYNQGFTAFVDGEETPIEIVNVGYMGIYLQNGYHEITFEYKVQGMNIGLYLSLVSIIAILGLTLIKARKKRDDY